MNPVISVEFRAKAGNINFSEETVTIHSVDELFQYISPGGGCENIPDQVDEIQFVFITPEHANKNNPIADKRATLELGMVFFTGPLSEIMETIEKIIDKAGRGELSDAFLSVSGCNH